MHVICTIRTDDVDELVRVDLGVHYSPVVDANSSVWIDSPWLIVSRSGIWPVHDRTRRIRGFL